MIRQGKREKILRRGSGIRVENRGIHRREFGAGERLHKECFG